LYSDLSNGTFSQLDFLRGILFVRAKSKGTGRDLMIDYLG